jgi:hypothetical protein
VSTTKVKTSGNIGGFKMDEFWRFWWRAYALFGATLVVCVMHGYYYWQVGSRWSLLMTFLVGINAGMLYNAYRHHRNHRRDLARKPLLPRALWPERGQLCGLCRERAIIEKDGARICLCCGDVGPATGWTWTSSPLDTAILKSAYPADSEWCDKCGVFAVVVMDGFATCLSCGESYKPIEGCPARDGGPCLRHCGPGMPRCRKLTGEHHPREYGRFKIVPSDPDRTDGT